MNKSRLFNFLAILCAGIFFWLFTIKIEGEPMDDVVNKKVLTASKAGSVSGKVSDNLTNQGIPNVEIIVRKDDNRNKEIKINSDQNGNFLLSDLAVGEYSIKFIAEHPYCSKNGWFEISGKEKLDVIINLKLIKGLSIKGKIFLKKNGICSPLKNANIEVKCDVVRLTLKDYIPHNDGRELERSSEDMQCIEKGISDAKGTYFVGRLSADCMHSYRVTVNSNVKGLAYRIIDDIQLSEDIDNFDIIFDYDDWTGVEGQIIYTTDGKSDLKKYRIVLGIRDEKGILLYGLVTPDDQGCFSLRNLPTGNYIISIGPIKYYRTWEFTCEAGVMKKIKIESHGTSSK